MSAHHRAAHKAPPEQAGGGEGGENEMEQNEAKEIQTAIIELLQQKNCTVRESKYILSQVSRYIEAFSAVQFRGMPDYEI